MCLYALRIVKTNILSAGWLIGIMPAAKKRCHFLTVPETLILAHHVAVVIHSENGSISAVRWLHRYLYARWFVDRTHFLVLLLTICTIQIAILAVFIRLCGSFCDYFFGSAKLCQYLCVFGGVGIARLILSRRCNGSTCRQRGPHWQQSWIQRLLAMMTIWRGWSLRRFRGR